MKAILSLFIFGAILSAAPVTTTVTYVDSGSPVVSTNDGNAGPYDLKVGGVLTQAMGLDDFDNVSGTWTAYETAVTSSDLSNTYLGNGSDYAAGRNMSDSNIYKMEAYLFSKLLMPGSDRADIQLAAWAIMDSDEYNSLVYHHDTAAENYITDAFNNYSTFNASGYEIISEKNAGRDPEQEFIISTNPVAPTPEPSTFLLLGTGLMAAGAFRFKSRAKGQKQQTL